MCVGVSIRGPEFAGLVADWLNSRCTVYIFKSVLNKNNNSVVCTKVSSCIISAAEYNDPTTTRSLESLTYMLSLLFKRPMDHKHGMILL